MLDADSPAPRGGSAKRPPRKQALRPSLRRSSIKITWRQLQGCTGFLLVTSTDRTVEALLEAGAVYERALLRATDLGVAHHTMSYALEEEPWREQIDSAVQNRAADPIIVRVGRAKLAGGDPNQLTTQMRNYFWTVRVP